MQVSGGIYHEKCFLPYWDEVYGSGLRGASILASLSGNSQLHSYCSPALRPLAEYNAKAFGISLNVQDTDISFQFNYPHILGDPVVIPAPHSIAQNNTLSIDSEIVLAYGMLECEQHIRCDRLIWDPQSPAAPNFPNADADSIAIILNEIEALKLTNTDSVVDAGAQLVNQTNVEVAVIKRGARGALVCTDTSQSAISAYLTPSHFAIGTGDIFSAAFAHFWGNERQEPTDSAVCASKAVAIYTETQRLDLKPHELTHESFLHPVIDPKKTPNSIYLAGPFFTDIDRRFVEEIFSYLESNCVPVFSPLHRVGFGNPKKVYQEDIDGLTQCEVVLALLDSTDMGTAFECGFATSIGKPVVVYSSYSNSAADAMFLGSECQLFGDLGGAINNAVWGNL